MPIVPPITVPTTWVDGEVLFAAPLNGNFAALLNWINTNGLTAITGNINIYVAPGGTGNGLTPSTPMGSITTAYNLVQDGYAFLNSAAVVTISLAAGTYTENVIISGVVAGQQNQNNVVIQGNAGAPTTVSIHGTPAMAFNHGAQVTVQGVQVVSGSGDGLFARHYSIVSFQAVDFGVCAMSQWKAWDAAIIEAIGNYSISGNAISHVHANGSGSNLYLSLQTNPNTPGPPGPTVTVGGGLTFSSAFAVASRNAVLTLQGAIFSSTTATGSQYSVIDNATIYTGTSGAMVLPGNSAGTTARNGIYD